MRLGISLSSTSGLPPEEAARHLIHRARTAALAELDSLSLGDRHLAGSAGYLQNVPALGRLLAEWVGRPAGLLFLLPQWPPVLVAEQVGTLAALHGGPFVVQTGLGGARAEFEALGAPVQRRVAVFRECVRIVDGLLRGEVVDSTMYGFAGARIAMVPTRPVDWWVGTGNPDGVRRAAELGAAWYAGPGARVDELRPLDAAYRAACDAHGTTARLMVRRDVVVLRDGDRARRLATDAVAAGYRGMSIDRLVVGNPEDAAEQLRPFAELGADEIVVRSMGISPETDIETIESLAEVRALIAEL